MTIVPGLIFLAISLVMATLQWVEQNVFSLLFLNIEGIIYIYLML